MNLPMSPDTREKILDQCAPPSQNNERRYWSKRIETWNRSRLQEVGEEIAERFGLGFDYKSGSDYGNEPESLRE